ncbi:MAG: lyase family protein [Planctomycetota bacterium]
MCDYNNISPLDSRYKEFSPSLYNNFVEIFSENGFLKYCAKVEFALLETLQEFNICPKAPLQDIEISISQVYEEEKRTEHQQSALVNVIRRKVPDNIKPYVHLFATSFDIVDTARALQLKDFVKKIFSPLAGDFINILIELAQQYKSAVQIGRTHGRFAEPITFGFYLVNFLDRFGRVFKDVHNRTNNLCGKLSGAVGSFAALTLTDRNPLEIEESFLKKLGLQPNPLHLSTQIVHPESVISLLLEFAKGFTILANIADDFRHLMRSEINEIIVEKEKNTIGSSTMPHKINPKDFEQIKSLWKKFLPQVLTFFMDEISEHQRDLTNSASGRFIGEFLYAFSYSLEKMTRILKNLHFNFKSAQENLRKAKGEIFAEPLYISLALSGEKAPYQLVYDFINKLRENGETDNYQQKIKEEDKFQRVLKIEKFAKVILEPQTYTGMCTKLTEDSINYWRKEIKKSHILYPE